MYVLVIFCYNFDTSTGYDTDNDSGFGKAGVQGGKIQTGKRKISQNSCGGPDIVGSKIIYLLSEQGFYFGVFRQIYDWTVLYL